MRRSRFRRSGLTCLSAWRPRRTEGRSRSSKPSRARKGPPRHRHPEAEIFRVLEGRYLYEMDGRRFYAEPGDVVRIPGGAEHGFVNVMDKPARQYILIVPALDAAAFFT
ncbi:MAG TPA: cupin domain-containing protein, partial [Roseiarcus sp.]